jgi:hypothetical protein
MLLPPGFRLRTFHPVVGRYTNYAVAAHIYGKYIIYIYISVHTEAQALLYDKYITFQENSWQLNDKCIGKAVIASNY